MRKRDHRTAEKRAADCRAWYLRNRERVKKQTALYRKIIKADPVAWKEYQTKRRCRYYRNNPALLAEKALDYWNLLKKTPAAWEIYWEKK